MNPWAFEFSSGLTAFLQLAFGVRTIGRPQEGVKGLSAPHLRVKTFTAAILTTLTPTHITRRTRSQSKVSLPYKGHLTGQECNATLVSLIAAYAPLTPANCFFLPGLSDGGGLAGFDSPGKQSAP